MATHKKSKSISNHDEYAFKCSHCYEYLIKTINLYDDVNNKIKFDFCPKCSGKI